VTTITTFTPFSCQKPFYWCRSLPAH